MMSCSASSSRRMRARTVSRCRRSLAERVHVPAGQSVDVYLYPEHPTSCTRRSMAPRRPQREWTVKFGVAETLEHGVGYAEVKLTTF